MLLFYNVLQVIPAHLTCLTTLAYFIRREKLVFQGIQEPPENPWCHTSSRLRKRLILHQFTLIFKFMYLIKFTPMFFSLTTENFLSQSTFSQTFHNFIFPCFPLPCSKTSSLSLGQNCSLPPNTPPHALFSSLKYVSFFFHLN